MFLDYNTATTGTDTEPTTDHFPTKYSSLCQSTYTGIYI